MNDDREWRFVGARANVRSRMPSVTRESERVGTKELTGVDDLSETIGRSGEREKDEGGAREAEKGKF